MKKRQVKLCIACSLDGYIAGPNGEIDWLFDPKDFDMAGFMSSVDTILMGRKTYDFSKSMGPESKESTRAHRRPFSQKRLVHTTLIGSLHQAPRATHNRAPARISRTVGDFRRSISAASSRLRQPLDPNLRTLQRRWLPERDGKANSGRESKSPFQNPARSMFCFAGRWVWYRAGLENETPWGTEPDLGSNSCSTG